MTYRTFLHLVLFWSVVFLAGCALPPREEGELGRRFTATVPGTWTGELKDGGISLQMAKTYRANGTAAGVLLMKRSHAGVSLVMPEVRFESRWRVTGDVVETYDIRASVPEMFKKGRVIRDRILSVQDNRIVSKPLDGGSIEVLERVKSSR